MFRPRPFSEKTGNKNVVIPKFDATGGIGGQYLESVLDVMRKVEHEMYNRQNALFEKTQRVSTDYREISARPIFLFIDELAALMTSADKAKKNVISRFVDPSSGSRKRSRNIFGAFNAIST